MKESTDRNACILIISQPSIEKVLENIEMEEKAPDEPSIQKSPTDLLNLAACGLTKNQMKVARSSSLTSRISIGLRSINSQIMDLPGTLRSIYIIIPMLFVAFLIGVFVSDNSCCWGLILKQLYMSSKSKKNDFELQN